MRGSVGLVIGLGGLVVGAGAMYLVLRPPWGGRGGAVPGDGPAIAVVTSDAGPIKKKKRPRHAPTSGQLPVQPQGENGEPEETEPLPPQLVALTGADRALEWRGDDVALPPRKVDMTSGAEARPLDDSEIQSTIAGQSSAVQTCVVQSATNTDLRATITVKMVVDGSGKVIKSRVQAPHYLQEKGLLGCIARAAARMHFPATGAPTLVTLPVTLT